MLRLDRHSAGEDNSRVPAANRRKAVPPDQLKTTPIASSCLLQQSLSANAPAGRVRLVVLNRIRIQSSSTVKITPQDRSILDLKLQRDKLKQYQRRIEVVLAREREIAAESLKAGYKSRALIALRQKKYQETLLSQTDAQLETLQKLVQSIEFSLVEKDVLYGLQEGNAVLKQLNKEMDLATVERLMDDTREGIAYQEAISAMLSSRMSAQDEEDVLAELATLQAEQVQAGVVLPEAPSHALPEVERLVATPAESAVEEEAPAPQRERRAVAA
ncbi:Vacuolar protein sorting-associated protein 20 [Rhodotorula sphaerocarpa]